MSVVTVFKVVELNKCKTLNSVGGLLGLALEIESYNMNRDSIEFNFTYSLNTPTNLPLCPEGDSLTAWGSYAYICQYHFFHFPILQSLAIKLKVKHVGGFHNLLI